MTHVDAASRPVRDRRWAGLFRTLAGGALALALTISAATAEPRHGLSAFGDLKYPADFKHFAYVNPNAPKGGRLSTIGVQARQTFDSFNNWILKGDPAQGLEFVYDTLMVRAFDEPDAVYGLVAKTADLSADRKTLTFEIDPRAKFNDGSPVTAEDVVFSFEMLSTKGHPDWLFPLRDVEKVDIPATGKARFVFKVAGSRDLPLTVALMPVLSKAFHQKHAFEETWLVPPVGSGPYRVEKWENKRYVQYRRRDDYWAKDHPVARGRFNFEELRLEYFTDRNAALEGFKAGVYDLREEFTAKDWATAYDFPAIRDGRVVRVTLPDDNPSGTQGFFLNMRRMKFQDVRVRKALDLAFDYEWMNKNIFFGLYKRTESYFENSELEATGKPSPAELALLEPFRKDLPAGVFGDAVMPTMSDGSLRDRNNLRAAAKLLDEAGYGVKNGKRISAKGEGLVIEFLLPDPGFKRVVEPYIKTLELIGIEATARLVDPSQYERRVKAFDFDIITQRFVLRPTPGLELRNFWSQAAADMSGSRNLSGIKSPVVDALIEKVIGAQSREELVTATRALDRVMRAGHYWVPHWYKASHNIAYWNRFDRPKTKPKYDRGVYDTWWFDAAASAKVGETRTQ